MATFRCSAEPVARLVRLRGREHRPAAADPDDWDGTEAASASVPTRSKRSPGERPGPQHYAEAERLLAEADEFYDGEYSGEALAVAQGHAMVGAAQVHATLALVAATADPDRTTDRKWREVLS